MRLKQCHRFKLAHYPFSGPRIFDLAHFPTGAIFRQTQRETAPRHNEAGTDECG
jgi:hypothetical protein